jgi:hypothetical protein
MPLLTDAIARVIDAAVFFGTNKPASWGGAIVTDATTAGNVVNRSVGTPRTDKAGLAGYFSDALAQVEGDGFDANGAVANTIYKGMLRNTRDANGNLLAEVSPTGIYGVPIVYPMRGLWPAPATGAAEAVVGDFTQAILGVRQDFTYKVITEGVIQDNTGVIQYNLPQQDMVALRVVFRCAFQTANTLNYDNPQRRHPLPVLGHQAGRLSWGSPRRRPARRTSPTRSLRRSASSAGPRRRTARSTGSPRADKHGPAEVAVAAPRASSSSTGDQARVALAPRGAASQRLRGVRRPVRQRGQCRPCAGGMGSAAPAVR